MSDTPPPPRIYLKRICIHLTAPASCVVAVAAVVVVVDRTLVVADSIDRQSQWRIQRWHNHRQQQQQLGMPVPLKRIVVVAPWKFALCPRTPSLDP